MDEIYGLSLHEEMKPGPLTIIRVPGGWVYLSGMGGLVFVPWTKTSKALEMREALEQVRIWRGIGMDPVEHFEAIGDMFQRDTGFLRPGKSEPMETYYDGREEERRGYWEAWCKNMNLKLDEQITAALAVEGT